ncbi:hypothetical protein BSK47_31210 [Paenibacillus odorifer]|uniref:Inhibitor of sigma-G Gin n=1 Tax=Paenibacillus odorifer TaxID=189426 RepID=A0AB36J643_9BACL|nr:hypothetical protein BSK47_31210 [Paenibacillus odorifer]
MNMKLNDENELTSGLIILCCSKHLFVPQSALDECEEIFCIECNSPMLFKGSDNAWYIPGKKVDF